MGFNVLVNFQSAVKTFATNVAFEVKIREKVGRFRAGTLSDGFWFHFNDLKANLAHGSSLKTVKVSETKLWLYFPKNIKNYLSGSS